MLDEVPAEICVVNTSEKVILGRLRDHRSRSTVVTAANGATGTASDPVWQTLLAAIAPGQTGCVQALPSTLDRPALNLWTDKPVHVLLNGREDFTDCRLPRELTAGVRLTFTYRSGAWGGTCRAETP